MSVDSHPEASSSAPGPQRLRWAGRSQGGAGSATTSSPFAPDRVRSASGAATAPQRQRPPKLYRIGEVVDYSGVSRQTIHNYTTMGLIRESRWTDGGHRLFDESVFERLDRIAEMKAANRSLQDIRDHFARLDVADGEGDSAPPARPMGLT